MTAQDQAFLADTRSFLSDAENLLQDALELSKKVHEQTAPRQRSSDVEPIGRANSELMDARKHLLNTVTYLKNELERLEQ
jgi:hypothetical protein